MKKNIVLTGIMPGNYMNWFITGNVNEAIQITLKDEQRVYLKEERQSKSMAAPVIQSCTDVTGTDLQIEIEAESLEVITTASDILSNNGVKQGRNYIFCCKLCNSFNDVFIQVSAWENATPDFAGDELIMNLFYQYLILKDKYLVNYINDLYIKEICSSYDSAVAGNASKLSAWYAEKSREVTDEVQKYKLILATLMKHESHYASSSPLKYYEWADMVIAFGCKRWKESKITMESCPFRYIRGIILNRTERDNFRVCYEALGSTPFFGEKMILASSHGTRKKSMGTNRTRLLNFRNCGLYVYSNSPDNQDEMINNSIQYATQEQAEILIFPELSINEEKIPDLIRVLNNQSGSLKLVMGGSYYEGDKDKYRNSSPILYKKNGEWEILTYYDKMIPFTMGKVFPDAENPPVIGNIDPKDYDLLVEDIQLSSNITVLPCMDGVIGVAICRDVMDLTDRHNPIHRYCDFVDLMLVISDNSGDSNMFTGTAECLARWHNCATLYTNSVAETGNKEPDDKLEVSFAIYPWKKGSGSTSVSGVITYISNPFDSVQSQSDFEKGMVGILYSKGIKYQGLTEEELKACCKTYIIE